MLKELEIVWNNTKDFVKSSFWWVFDRWLLCDIFFRSDWISNSSFQNNCFRLFETLFWHKSAFSWKHVFWCGRTFTGRRRNWSKRIDIHVIRNIREVVMKILTFSECFSFSRPRHIFIVDENEYFISDSIFKAHTAHECLEWCQKTFCLFVIRIIV